MPPKRGGKGAKRGKAGKAGAAAGGGAAAEEDQEAKLTQVLEALTSRLQTEQEQRNYYQLERDKINAFWDITKREVEELRAELRNKERELEEADERRQVELKIYKQKVRHLLYEHKLSVDQLKLDGETALKLKEDAHRVKEGDLKREKRESRSIVKEQEHSHERVNRKQRQDHDMAISNLREEFERQARELQLRYEKKLNTLREEMNLQRKNEVMEISHRKNQHIRDLMAQHEKAFRDIKEYYNDITSNNIELIKGLKEELETMKMEEATNEKDLFDTIQENKKLREPLARTLKEVERLRQEKANYEKDKIALRNAKARLLMLEQHLKDMEWEHEVLQQRFQQVQKERDELYDRFEGVVAEVEQRAGFKNLLLEKKLVALQDALQKRDVQLGEVLSAANLDPGVVGVVTQKLDDVLEQKNMQIRELQDELARVTKAHNDAIHVYESRLVDHGISVEELGFRPLVARTMDPITGEFREEMHLGGEPSGLVSA